MDEATKEKLIQLVTEMFLTAVNENGYTEMLKQHPRTVAEDMMSDSSDVEKFCEKHNVRARDIEPIVRVVQIVVLWDKKEA